MEDVFVAWLLENIVALLAFFPIVGGVLGAAAAAFSNLVKAFRVIPDEYGGVVFAVINAALVVWLLNVGVDPEAYQLHEDITEVVDSIVVLITFIAGLVTAGWKIGPIFHEKVMLPLAPTVFSTTARKNAEKTAGNA